MHYMMPNMICTIDTQAEWPFHEVEGSEREALQGVHPDGQVSPAVGS